MSNSTHPLILTILDGWGYNPHTAYNAIAQANTPHWDQWWEHSPKTLINCAGPLVGLPEGQMGNSEVGHMHMGAGRVIDQDLSRINKAIQDGQFFQNPILNSALAQANKNNSAIHVIGLVSAGGVHSHEAHIYAIAKLIAQQGGKKLYIHAMLDGRDTPPRSAEPSLKKLDQTLARLGVGEIASIIGRYYPMDRDERWDRTAKAYQLIMHGTAPYRASNALEGLKMAYDRNENDEFIQPTTTLGKQITQANDGDVIIFMNFRADRARQLTHAIVDESFNSFPRGVPPALAKVVTLTKYATDINAQVAFPPVQLPNTMGELIAKRGMRQLRIAETEKYAHVTFFFNGGMEKCFPKEQRILIPSPKVSTYDQAPEMSAPELTNELVAAIENRRYDVIICNFANADMVGHTGNIPATVRAIECLDQCVGRIREATQRFGGEMLITADHGNAEFMYDESINQPHTAHTHNPVPFIYLGRKAKITTQAGSLIDIAPTMLYLLNLEKPKEMSGQSLLKLI